MPEMVAPRALVFRPLVKGNEVSVSICFALKSALCRGLHNGRANNEGETLYQKDARFWDRLKSFKKLSDNKLSDNNLASELVENFKPITIEEIVIL